MTGKLIRTVSFILVFGLIAICNLTAQTNGLNGTWVNDEHGVQTEFILNNGYFENSVVTSSGSTFSKGNYTAENGILTIERTHIMWVEGRIVKILGLKSGKWYTYNEELNIYRNLYQKEGIPESEINRIIELMSSSSQYDYLVDSSFLILTKVHTFEGFTFIEDSVYTRK